MKWLYIKFKQNRQIGFEGWRHTRHTPVGFDLWYSFGLKFQRLCQRAWVSRKSISCALQRPKPDSTAWRCTSCPTHQHMFNSDSQWSHRIFENPGIDNSKGSECSLLSWIRCLDFIHFIRFWYLAWLKSSALCLAKVWWITSVSHSRLQKRTVVEMVVFLSWGRTVDLPSPFPHLWSRELLMLKLTGCFLCLCMILRWWSAMLRFATHSVRRLFPHFPHFLHVRETLHVMFYIWCGSGIVHSAHMSNFVKMNSLPPRHEAIPSNHMRWLQNKDGSRFSPCFARFSRCLSRPAINRQSSICSIESMGNATKVSTQRVERSALQSTLGFVPVV